MATLIIIILLAIAFLIFRKNFILLLILFFVSSAYQSARQPSNGEWLHVTGIFVDGKIIDPIYGKLYTDFNTGDGSLIRGKGKFTQYLSFRRITQTELKWSKKTPISLLMKLRDSLDIIISENIRGDIGNMCSAILLGKRKNVPNYMYRRFQYCGAAHLLAVSGLHMGIVFGVIFILIRVLHLRRKKALVISGLFAFIYALLTGFRLPVIRAFIMLGIFILGEILERNSKPLNTLSAAGIIILIISPVSIYSISFQLSFAAVLSILIILDISKDFINSLNNGPIKNWIVLPLLVTLSAQIGTLPLVAYYFGYIPVFGLSVNLVLIPLVGALIAGVFILWIIPFTRNIAGSFVWLIGLIMNKIMILIERIPFGVIQIPKRNKSILLLYPVITILLITYFMVTRRGME